MSGPPQPHQTLQASLPPEQWTDEAVQLYWKVFPSAVKYFILNTLDKTSFLELVRFWSSHVEYINRTSAKDLCGPSYFLANVYLHRHEFDKARALTLNGAFLQECLRSTFDKIFRIYTNGCKQMNQLPLFCNGFYATRCPSRMQNYFKKVISQEYQQAFVNKVRENRNLKNSQKGSYYSKNDDDDITLNIGNDSFQVRSSSSLKTVFNDYAEKNSICLKSLRFSYQGKTLFLSTVGVKSLDEFGIFDNDTIEVYPIQEPTLSENNKHAFEANKSEPKKQKMSTKKTRSKTKKGSSKIEVVKSGVEGKEEHSALMTKLFEEADPQFRLIRQKLNTLSLSKEQSKTKKVHVKQCKQVVSFPAFDPELQGLGGKAGKSRFVINVGEVSNLYKSSKSLSTRASCTASTIDLHGCTKEEALSKLNAGLTEWNEQAMLGSYPFIHSVTIICGSGGQVLSEVVEEWIHTNHNVSKAPKTKTS